MEAARVIIRMVELSLSFFFPLLIKCIYQRYMKRIVIFHYVIIIINVSPIHLFAEKKMIPVENHGIKCMSIGLLVEKDAPIVWRGPMVCLYLLGLLFYSFYCISIVFRYLFSICGYTLGVCEQTSMS